MFQNRTFDLHFIHARIITYLRYPHLDLDSREKDECAYSLRTKSEIRELIMKAEEADADE